jgi:hypothetical protein
VWVINPDDATKSRLPQDGTTGVDAQFTRLTAAPHASSLRRSVRNYIRTQILPAADVN